MVEPQIKNKIFIVVGYRSDKHASTWIEEVFDDENQAFACCRYLNIKNPDKINIEYIIYPVYDFCKENYRLKLSRLECDLCDF